MASAKCRPILNWESEKMAVLITGAGLVGSQVAQRLVEMGEKPILFDVAPSMDNLERIVDLSKVKIVRGDVLEPFELMKVIQEEGVDRLIHTAAVMTTVMRERLFTGIRINVMGMANILEVARLTNLKRVVLTSSNTVYFGALPYFKGDLWSEDFPIMCLSGRSPFPYATTKLFCEQLGLHYHDIYGLDFVAVRFAGVFGPWKTPVGVTSEIMAETIKRVLKEKLVVLKKNLSWSGKLEAVYSKDAAHSTILACYAEKPQQRVYNISMGEMYSHPEVVEILKKLNPQIGIQVDEIVGEYFGGLPPMPQQPLDISKAREELGYEPEYKMELAIKDYTAWLKADLS